MLIEKPVPKNHFQLQGSDMAISLAWQASSDGHAAPPELGMVLEGAARYKHGAPPELAAI